MDRMECLRLALGGYRDNAKILTVEEAQKAVEAADILYAYACQDMPPAEPMRIEGIAVPVGYDIGG